MLNNADKEVLLNVGRVYDEEEKIWIPFITEIKNEEIEAVWGASILYLLYNKMLSKRKEEEKAEYAKDIKNYFNNMLNSAEKYVEEVHFN